MSELIKEHQWIFKTVIGTGFFTWLCTFVFQKIPQISERKWRFSVEKFNMLQKSIKPFLENKPTKTIQRVDLEHSIFRYTSQHIDYELIIKAYQKPKTIKNINILRKYGGLLKLRNDKVVLKKKGTYKELPSKKAKSLWTKSMVSIYVISCTLIYFLFLTFSLKRREAIDIPDNALGWLAIATTASLSILLLLLPHYNRSTALHSLSDLNKEESFKRKIQSFF